MMGYTNDLPKGIPGWLAPPVLGSVDEAMQTSDCDDISHVKAGVFFWSATGRRLLCQSGKPR